MIVRLETPILSVAFMGAVSDTLRRDEEIYVHVLARKIMPWRQITFQ